GKRGVDSHVFARGGTGMWPVTGPARTEANTEGLSSAYHPPEPPLRSGKDHSTEFAQNAAEFLGHCARSCGDIFALRFGAQRVLVVNHPGDIEYVMVHGNRHFTKAFSLNYQPILGNGLFMSDGPLWLRQRRLLQPIFQRERVAIHGPSVVA